MRIVKGEKPLRAGLYLRYSDDIQNDLSIERQTADLEKVAPRLNLTLDKRHYCADRGKTAQTLYERPGLTRKLLGLAERGEIDVVLVEHTDRISRKPRDLYLIADQLAFFNVKIYTPKGEVDALQLCFDSYKNADDTAKTAFRVKSGHDQNTRDGKFCGGKCYGYDNLPGARRVRNEEHAKVINRICIEYANGGSPRKICKGLERDGILSPTGKKLWNWQYILRLLDNELYRGRLVRNRFKKVRNPRNNDKKISRVADPDDLVERDVPELRIISDQLWNAVQARRGARRAQMNPAGTKPTLVRKPHLILDLMKCATCYGKMTSLTKGIIVCSNARYRETCDHKKSYKLDLITPEVVKKVEKELTDPEFLKRRIRARALELAKEQKKENEERDTVQARIDGLTLRIKQLIRMSEGLPDVEEIMAEINAKEAERASLRERLKSLGDGSNVLTIPDEKMSAFGSGVDKLVKLIKRNPDDPDCRRALHNVLWGVVVHPTPKKRPYDVAIYARVSAVGNLELFPAVRPHERIVAEEGVKRFFGLGNSDTSI